MSQEAEIRARRREELVDKFNKFTTDALTRSAMHTGGQPSQEDKDMLGLLGEFIDAKILIALHDAGLNV